MNGNGIPEVSFSDVDFNKEDYWRVAFDRDSMKDCVALNIANNRKLKRNAETYARDMRNGRWIVGAGPVIVFNEDGRMIDGNGRMHAALLSGCERIVFDVKTMAPNDSFKVLDSGASRSDGDGLAFRGFKNPATCASIARVAMTLRNGANNVDSHRGINIAPSRQEVVDFAVLNERVISELATRFTAVSKKVKVRNMGPRLWFVAWWLTYCMNHEKADQFFMNVIEKVGVGRMLVKVLDEQNEDGRPHSHDWLLCQYIDTFSTEIMGTEYELGKNAQERLKGLKKTFAEYANNMREVDDLFDWRFEKYEN